MKFTDREKHQTAPHPTVSRLYDGEVLTTIAEHPCIYRFLPSTSYLDAKSLEIPKPLVIFIPGAAHFARIAYGVPSHSSHASSDFLAYHLNNLGYSFVAISYPLESAYPSYCDNDQDEDNSTSSLIPAISPDFRITDWGKQAAEVTAKIISEHGLPKCVVLTSWSMGGRMIVPYTRHAKALGLNVKAFFPLSASAGLQSSIPPVKDALVTKNGYAMLGEKYETPFLQQIHMQQDEFEGGREVLPDAVWRRDYFGHVPVSLMDWKLRCLRLEDNQNGIPFKFVEDRWQSCIDSDVADVANLPSWIVSMYSNCKLDAKHGVMDRAIWGSLLAQKIMNRVEEMIARNKKNGKSFTDEQWQRLLKLTHSLPEKLSLELTGTHYFFLGQTGARKTAVSIDRLLGVTDQLENELRNILEE